MESGTMRNLLLVLSLVALFPNLAAADPGSGTDLPKVQRETEAMQRDGRWEKLLAEGQANKQAFETLKRADRQMPVVMWTGSLRQRRP